MSVGPGAPWTILLLVGAVLTVLLLAIGTVTLGKSITCARRDRRRESVRPAVRAGIIERLDAEDPGWEVWVDTLDRTEKSVAEDVLAVYLRQVGGADRERLQALGSALGIEARAKDGIEHGDKYDRLAGMSWLARLEVAPPPERLRACCGVDPDERAAGARLLHAANHPDAQEAGTDMLLTGDEPLSTFGVDTLYRLNASEPDLVLEYARRSYESWSESRLIQVLRVVAEAESTASPASLGWIGFLFVSESAEVRAAGARALSGYGWLDPVRNQVDVSHLVADESPVVRRAVYRMLGGWGDREALEALLAVLEREDDARSAVVALTTLGRYADLTDRDLTEASAAAHAWVDATGGATVLEGGR